jgi:hypothetical protein
MVVGSVLVQHTSQRWNEGSIRIKRSHALPGMFSSSGVGTKSSIIIKKRKKKKEEHI